MEHIDTIHVLEAFACYIAYGDTEGLEQSEIDSLESYLSDYPEDAHLSIGDEYDEFGRCEATQLMGRTIPVEVYCQTESN